MSDTIMLEPVLFAVNDDPFDDSDEEDIAQEVEASQRPSHVKAALLAFLAAMAAISGKVATNATSTLGTGTTPTRAGGGTVAAEAAGAAARAATEAYAREAERVIAEHAPKVAAALSKWVIDATGLKTPISTAKVERDLTAKIQSYLAGNAVDLRKAANVAVVNWHVVPGSTELELRAALARILDGATWQARRIVVTETQEAYKSMFRDGIARAGTAKVERIAMPTACDFCKAAAGVYNADDTSCYDTHPNCEDIWAPAPDDATVDFSRTVTLPPVALGSGWDASHFAGPPMRLEAVR